MTEQPRSTRAVSAFSSLNGTGVQFSGDGRYVAVLLIPELIGGERGFEVWDSESLETVGGPYPDTGQTAEQVLAQWEQEQCQP